MSIKVLNEIIKTKQENYLERLVILYLADCVDEASDYVVNLTNMDYLQEWCCANKNEIEHIIEILIEKKILIPIEHDQLSGKVYRMELMSL